MYMKVLCNFRNLRTIGDIITQVNEYKHGYTPGVHEGVVCR